MSGGRYQLDTPRVLRGVLVRGWHNATYLIVIRLYGTAVESMVESRRSRELGTARRSARAGAISGKAKSEVTVTPDAEYWCSEGVRQSSPLARVSTLVRSGLWTGHRSRRMAYGVTDWFQDPVARMQTAQLYCTSSNIYVHALSSAMSSLHAQAAIALTLTNPPLPGGAIVPDARIPVRRARCVHIARN